jgi:hypothetical protein
MSTLSADLLAASEWIAAALLSSGYKADFSPGSLWEIERFFDEHTANGVARPDGLLAQDLGARLFAIGGYIGETIQRSKGGRWVENASEPNDEINVALELPDGTSMWPVVRAMKRLEGGSADSIVAYAKSFGLDVGPAPDRGPRTSLFGRFFGRK